MERLKQPSVLLKQLPEKFPPCPLPPPPPPTTSVSASSSRQRSVSFDSLSFFWSFIMPPRHWEVTIPDFSFREACTSGHRNQLTMTVNISMTFNMGKSDRNIMAQMRLLRSSSGSLRPEAIRQAG